MEVDSVKCNDLGEILLSIACVVVSLIVCRTHKIEIMTFGKKFIVNEINVFTFIPLQFHIFP